MPQSIVENIANGTFDIYELPKLHRHQTLHDLYIQKNIEGIVHPLDGGKLQLLHVRTKLQNTFNELDSLLSAWLTYAGICATFAPQRGPGLFSWTDRIIGYNRLKYNFTAILDYFVAYFQLYQNSPPEQWFQAVLSTICSDTERIRNRSTKDRSTSHFQRSWKTVQDRRTLGSRSTYPWIPTRSIFMGLNLPK